MPTYPFKDFAGSSHTILIRLIRRWAPRGGRLIDLGAWGGELGQATRDHSGETFGFDHALAAMETLGQRYDHVVIADLDRVDRLPRRADAVILADMLEHLSSPERLLRVCVSALTDDGRIFVSLPNVANLAIRLSLLAGRFEYADRGILDRTHLRFYTRKTARELIEGCGLEILHEECSTIPVRYAIRMPRPMLYAVERLLVILTRLRPTLLGYQFIFVARKRSAR